MPEQLQTRLQELRQRLRQMTWLYGVSWLVTVVFGATLAAGLLDWSIHIEDPGLRMLFGLGIVASAGWISWKLLLKPLRRQISDVEIALRIEKRFPGFNDGFASAVQFLTENQASSLGSPALKGDVVSKTVEQVERINLADIVETRRVKKIAFWAVGICLLSAILAGWNQAAAATALHRLMFPFANRPWPKTTELQLIGEDGKPLQYNDAEPLRMAEGDKLDLYVENVKGHLPYDVRMEYKFDEDDVVSEVLRRTTLPRPDGPAKDVCIATIVATKGPMTFRAVGGDDEDMPWQHLEVVPPPGISTLNVRLTPPKYTGQPAESLPEGVGHIRGLVGTKVHLQATANKPLQRANLRVKDQPPQRANLSNNGKDIEVDFVIGEAGVYSWWFDLKDLEGFENPDAPRYEVRGTADLVPDVWIDEPARDGNVTPTASVPIIVGAKDDLGIKEIRLQYRIGDDPMSPLKTIPLFDGQDRPLQHRVEFLWELSELPLQPGMSLTFHAEAIDDCDLEGEHVGRSIDRKLTVVTPEEKSAELNYQQGGLIDELDTAHKMQVRTREQVEQLRIQLQTAGELQAADLDLLKRLEFEQRQINSRLAHPDEGLSAHIGELLREIELNKIEDPEMVDRLEGIRTEIKILEEDHLPKIEQNLTNARKIAQTKKGIATEEPLDQNAEDERKELDNADNHQAAVADSLGEMLDELSKWQRQRDLTGEVGQLINDQEAINQETGEVKGKTAGKRSTELSPQERADLARLANRQRKQAQRLQDFSETLQDAADKLKENSPRAEEILGDAADHLREQALASRLRDTANQLERNEVGNAGGQQSEALEALQELADILKDRGVSDTETLVKKLKQARDELQNLGDRQEELKKKMSEAEQIADREKREQALEMLRQEQQRIRREVSSLARRLRRLNASQPGTSLRRAANRMEQIEQLLQEIPPEPVENEQQEILDDLEQAERELAEETRRAEERLAQEMLERIGDELKSMIARQQNAIDETNRLEAERKRNGGWKRAQLKSLKDLKEVQDALRRETVRLAELVESAEVFALALKGAAREMERAVALLDERDAGGKTVARETNAKNRFVDLVAALDSQQDKTGKPQENNAENAGNATNPGRQTDGIPHLAQLKMLKSLQEDLIRRTLELDRTIAGNEEATEDQQLEMKLLSGEQGLLADLTRNLTAQYAEAFQTEPSTPDQEKTETKPVQKPENKKPNLEEQLLKDLGVDDPLPGDDAPGDKRSEAEPWNNRVFAVVFQAENSEKKNDAQDDAAQGESKPPKADEDLFRQLVGESPAGEDPTKNPLEEAIQGMRSAQERIREKDTSEETRKIQEDVVANLQKLIDLAKNNPPPPPSAPPDSPQNPMNQEQNPMERSPQEQPMDSQPDKNSQEPMNNRKETDNAEDSSNEDRESRKGSGRISPRPEMLNDVWGHLPPSVRKQLLSLSSDKYLPKYEDLARRYFESLAEPSARPPRSPK